MRLIDADELINFLRTENQRCITSTGHELSLSIIATLIEFQPTAYDIGKVVEEFEERTDFSEKLHKIRK